MINDDDLVEESEIAKRRVLQVAESAQTQKQITTIDKINNECNDLQSFITEGPVNVSTIEQN